MTQETAYRFAILAGLVTSLVCAGCGGGSQSTPPAGSGGASAAGGDQGKGGSTSGGGATSAGGAVATGGVSGVSGAGGVTSAGGVQASGGGAGSSSSAPDAAAGFGGSTSVRDAGATSKEVASPASCPAPPAGAPAAAVTAINVENTARVAMGIPCATLVLSLCTSAQNHCNYYATNVSSTTCKAASAHDEISGCPQFTGVDPGAREKAAGYSGSGWSECIAFVGDPANSVQQLIDTVYHRIPMLSPWWRDFGYGNATGCDTIDFGPGAATDKTITAVYPYDGQTGVPLSFNGAYEGPTPPAPSTGWPSGYPVTLYGKGITVTAHQIVVDGTTTPLVHVWIDGDATTGADAKVLYTEAPLAANTTYRVTIDGSTAAGSVHFEWTFTTGAATSPGGGRRG